MNVQQDKELNNQDDSSYKKILYLTVIFFKVLLV